MATQSAHMPERSQKTGRYVPGFSDADLLSALDALGGAAGTAELATETEANYDAVYQRLRRLEDKGRVRRRKVANANLWLLADETDSTGRTNEGASA
jgi:DNA-binding HxlR family transcriptional regulator